MELTCPQCQFTRNIPDEKIPSRAEIATCPKCKHKFHFRHLDHTAESIPPPEESAPPDEAAISHAGSASAGESPLPGMGPVEDRSRERSEDFWDNLASMGRPHQEKQSQTGIHPGPDTDPSIEVPWEHLEKYGFFPGLWETIKRAMFQPAAFFQSMPVGGGQVKPLIFYLLIAIFQIVMQMLWDMTGVGADATGEAGLAGVNAMVLLVVYPLILTVMLYILAALVHACLNLVGVVTRGFEGTFRALTYGSAPMVMVVIPMAGPLIGALWSLVVTFLGYKYIHRATTGKVLLAMLLPLIPFALLLAFVLTAAHNSGAPTF